MWFIVLLFGTYCMHAFFSLVVMLVVVVEYWEWPDIFWTSSVPARGAGMLFTSAQHL